MPQESWIPKPVLHYQRVSNPATIPGYSTLGQQEFWDAHTREVVLKRVHEVPPDSIFHPG